MEIWQYDFMWRALGAGLLVGMVCPLVGFFITLRRMSMLADALSHVCLSGVTAGLFLGAQPVLVASLFAVGGSLLLEGLREKYKNYAELSIAIVLSTGVAVGAVLLGLGDGLGGGVMSYLFGSIVLISAGDILVITAIGLPVLMLTLFCTKELFCTTFDEDAARVAGLPVRLINAGFAALTALTIAVSIRIVGILLASSLMVLPVAAAMRLARGFRGTLVASVISGEAAVVTGLVFSFYLDLPPGGTIVLTLVLMLLGVLLLASRRVPGREGE